MGYVYDSLVTALGGNNLTTALKEGSVLKGWSPNMFKRIFVLNDGIVIDYHSTDGKKVRVVPLSLDEVAKDLSSGKSRNIMKVFSSYKAFSCLEELVLSKDLVDLRSLESYASSVAKTSRLRTVGVSGGNIGVISIQSALDRLASTGMVTELVSSIVSGISSKVVDTDGTYYKRYLLRPTYYAMDSERCVLARHFADLESRLEGDSEKAREAKEAIARADLDAKNIKFWSCVIDFYGKLDKFENHGNIKAFAQELSVAILASERSYVRGIRLVPGEHVMKPIYKSLGYLKEREGGERSLWAGYLPNLDTLGDNMFNALGRLISSNSVVGLNTLKVSGNTSKALILYKVLSILCSEEVGVGDEVVKGSAEALEFESKLTTEMSASLFEVVTLLKDRYRTVVKVHLAWREGLPKFSSKKLIRAGLVRQEEVLSLLGYTGGDDSWDRVSELPFESGVLSLCKESARNLQEGVAKPWLPMSFVQRCDFILERN